MANRYICINGHILAHRGDKIGEVDGQPVYGCGADGCRAEAEPVEARGRDLSDHPFQVIVASDVYEETPDQDINLVLRTGPNGSLIIDDAPQVDGGSFNIVLENRRGVPYLLVWAERDFSNDPTFTIRLDEGTLN